MKTKTYTLRIALKNGTIETCQVDAPTGKQAIYNKWMEMSEAEQVQVDEMTYTDD